MAGLLAVPVILLTCFGGALMKPLGFVCGSVGSAVLFFVVSGLLAFPVEPFVRAIPKVLFSHFGKISAREAKLLFVVLDTGLSMVIFSVVDHFMESVSASPAALFVLSLVMALLCRNDAAGNGDG